jgi:hypothetical protein
MPTVTLQHCVPVVIYGPSSPPQEVTLDLTIGGSAGDGIVDVTAGPGQLPGPVSLPTGSSGTYPLPAVTIVKLHYIKSSGGPMSVSVTYDVS